MDMASDMETLAPAEIAQTAVELRKGLERARELVNEARRTLEQVVPEPAAIVIDAKAH